MVFLAALAAAGTASSPRRESLAQKSGGDVRADEAQATVDRLKKSLAAETLVWQLSTPEEVIACLGEPRSRKEEREGGGSLLSLEYPDCVVVFSRFAETRTPGPFTLIGYVVGEERIRAPQGYVLRLRNKGDLDRLNPFYGLQEVDLRGLDLREERERLLRSSFDTRTLWPSVERLPQGFDPIRRLENARNPGLGIRALQARGIDGRVVAIAIIDQPLLEDHDEYRQARITAVSIDVEGIPPQMHGPYVAGFAVGKTLGTAPRADLHFYATPMWKPTNAHFIRALDLILQENASSANPVRVVSISTGMFPQYPDYPAWQQAVERAEAAGILVLSCASNPGFPLGMLARREGGDAERPEGWQRGIYFERGGLLVPAGGRTHAGLASRDCYVFDPKGGFSAVPPTLAGICALALQVNPGLNPAELRLGLVQTAWKTEEGPIVNPAAFVEWARQEENQERKPGDPGGKTSNRRHS
jgi:hypothetical protein